MYSNMTVLITNAKQSDAELTDSYDWVDSLPLKKPEKALYQLFLRYSHNGIFKVAVEQQQIAEAIGKKKRAAIYTLNSLIEKGLVKKIDRFGVVLIYRCADRMTAEGLAQKAHE